VNVRSTQRLKKTQIRSATWGRLQALCTKKEEEFYFSLQQHNIHALEIKRIIIHELCIHHVGGPRPHLVCPYKSQAPGQILADIKGSHQNMQSKKRERL